MTTPTNENRDTERAEPAPRQKLDLSVTKIAAGASAAALAAAVGSKLGVAGTIAGAAVASVVSTSASTVIGHSLERGKTAARKAMPALDPEQLETAILSRTRNARVERSASNRVAAVATEPLSADEPAALTRVDGTAVMPALADRALADSALDETVVLNGAPHPGAETTLLPTGPNAQTVVLPKLPPNAADTPRTWRDRVPGRKSLIAAAVASFMVGTGAVTALEVARKGEFPGYHSNVFTNDPGQSGGAHDQPATGNSGGPGTHEGSTPSQKPGSPAPTSSGSSGQTPSTTPSTQPSPGPTPSTPGTPSTSPSSGPATPSTTPATGPTGSADPTPGASPPGASTPGAQATGAGQTTPTNGPTG